jgi:hypothetical protein
MGFPIVGIVRHSALFSVFERCTQARLAIQSRINGILPRLVLYASLGLSAEWKTDDLGFLFWEFPTVYIAQKLRLAKYLGCNVVVWGAILMLQGATTNFGAFFALRFLLGMSRGDSERGIFLQLVDSKANNFYRDVRMLRCADFDLDYFDVLQEG